MSLPFSIEDLEKAIEDGQVTKRPHPTLPLYIYNYSPAVQYSNRWNDVTLNCRGLVLDADYNIVARPWKKFFNLGQVNLPIQLTDPVEVMDKADGSLGILYGWHGDYAISTRGSFQSEQAIHATNLWINRYSHHDKTVAEVLQGAYTFLFEIVYPQNRIVLNYDGMDDLILLGAVENAHGYYLGPETAASLLEWDGPVVKVFDFNTISDALGHMERENAEGYVIRSHNFMVKLKQPDYLELHRMVTNMTPKTIWESLRSGKSVAEICAALPDEFHSMAKDIAEPLVAKYSERLDEIMVGYGKATGNLFFRYGGSDLWLRKNVAAEFKKSQDARYYFSILDGRSISDMLWTELKPKELL